MHTKQCHAVVIFSSILKDITTFEHAPRHHQFKHIQSSRVPCMHCEDAVQMSFMYLGYAVCFDNNTYSQPVLRSHPREAQKVAA